MRIGCFIDVNAAPYGDVLHDRGRAADALEAIVAEALAAERAGFHGLQVPDRHGRGELFPGPLQLLTILARETQRVAIGAGALVLTGYHPMEVAASCAVIDNLLRGRFYLTLARGWNDGDWAYRGVPRERLLGRLLEGLRILQLANAGERFSYAGDFYAVENAQLTPLPFQDGGYPLWGGGQAPAAIRRAASFASAWLCDPFPLDPAAWAEQAGAYREYAESLGKRPFIGLMRYGWVADSFEEAARRFAVFAAAETAVYQEGGLLDHRGDYGAAGSITPESVRSHLVIGTRDQCIETIERYRDEFGVDYVTIMPRLPAGPPLEEVREQVQRFGEEVVSYFHASPPDDHPAIPQGARW